MNTAPPVVLVVAGLDPSGGAGLAADIQAITAAGAHPAPVASSLTVQDTRNAYEVRVLEPSFVAAQMRAVIADLPVAAVKLGLLGSAEVADAVLAELAALDVPVVVDPVLYAAGGAQLAEDALIGRYRGSLAAIAAVITPNAEEARRLHPEGGAIDTAVLLAAPLIAAGAQHVLLKGADEPTEDVRNTLVSADGEVRSQRTTRMPGVFHGSGCTLAAAIAARLALGLDPVEAVEQALAYTDRAIREGFTPGSGQAIPRR